MSKAEMGSDAGASLVEDRKYEALCCEFDAVVESSIAALSEHSTESLRRVAEEATRRNPNGWLAPMIREYLDVWR